MTEGEELERAAEAAEAEVKALEAEHAALAEKRSALSRQAFLDASQRHQAATQALQSAREAEQALHAELASLQRQLRAPGFRLPSLVATPMTWFLRSTAFGVYCASVLWSYWFIHSIGLVLALLLALPVAFVLVMVAGSLRESAPAGTLGDLPGQGEDPARIAAADERAITSSGGAGDPGAAEHRSDQARTGAHRGG